MLSLETIVMLALGLVCLALWRPLGVKAYEQQRRLFSVRSSPQIYQMAYLIAGVALVTLAVLTALGVVRFGL